MRGPSAQRNGRRPKAPPVLLSPLAAMRAPDRPRRPPDRRTPCIVRISRSRSLADRVALARRPPDKLLRAARSAVPDRRRRPSRRRPVRVGNPPSIPRRPKPAPEPFASGEASRRSPAPQRGRRPPGGSCGPCSATPLANGPASRRPGDAPEVAAAVSAASAGPIRTPTIGATARDTLARRALDPQPRAPHRHRRRRVAEA